MKAGPPQREDEQDLGQRALARGPVAPAMHHHAAGRATPALSKKGG